MSRLEQLRGVGNLIGIEQRHVDALGVEHQVDEDTLAQLIAAIGLPSDPQHAAEALAEEERAAPFGLRNVYIMAQEQPAPALQLRLPAGAGTAEWHLHREEGVQQAGRSDGAQLQLPTGLPLGYHRLQIRAPSTEAEIDLIVAPPSCHLPEELRSGHRSWALCAQLYGLRSDKDWGIGDFGHLARLARRAGTLGAAAVGLNPLHALFAAEPRHFSPYSPSTRLWLDYLYIDVTAVPGFAEDADTPGLTLGAIAAAAHDADLIDYAKVATVKRPVLEALYRRFRTGAGEQAAFREFQKTGGAALKSFATFEALHEHFLSQGGPFSWRDWPEPMRNPNSPEVGEFARAHADRVEFFEFLQWHADRQLATAAAAGCAGGLAVGLYRDLAVGVNPNGAEAWADQELVAPGASIGAPPDPLSRAGQNWGLAPTNPLVLRRRSFAPLIAALRANMRHSGILRIDHVMGLRRLYWIPRGAAATEGAYVNYPLDDLLRLVALESQRHRCAVIGEDLGTVPEGFREAMQAAKVLSYRILSFERHHDGSFAAPSEYPPLAAASAATHDLATVKGFWLGVDIGWRRRLSLYPDPGAEETEAAERRRDRQLLLDALAREGLLAPERFGEFVSPEGEPTYSLELGEMILAYLARSRSRLLLVQLEDIVGESDQANLPGTTDAHPNWRRRLSVPLEALLAGPELARIAEIVGAGREWARETQRE